MSLRDAWERNAASWIAWAREPDHDGYWRYHRDQFLELVPPPGRRTLDVGCGEGRLARDLKALGHVVAAVDASPTMVEAAREADPELAVELADATALPFAGGAFDLVVAFMSLQDVDDMEGAVGEAARVLEPGGRLCLAIVHPFASAGAFERIREHRTRKGQARTGRWMRMPLFLHVRAVKQAAAAPPGTILRG